MEKKSLGPSTLVFPMPSFLIGSMVNGKPNVMTCAWGGVACGNPPIISIAVRPSRYSYLGIQENETFSVNVPNADVAVQADYCGIVSGKKKNKIEVCDYSIFYGHRETAPMIEECPINLECKLINNIELGSHNLLLGEVVDTFVSENCFTDGQLDINIIKPLVYSPGPVNAYQTLSEILAPAFKCGKELVHKK